jgi:hypothetical protein
MNKFIYLIIAIIVIIAGVAGYFIWQQNQQPGKLDAFAKCIASSGTTFYGAFWCPHCQNEKSFFGNSAQYLPYVECSTPDSNGELQVCINQKVTGYPTWKFKDGTTQEGEMTLQELATKTGCVLPQ